MWKKTILLTINFLLLISLALAYTYVASKGNNQVWADDLEAHNTKVTLPFKFCNLNANPKTLKPTSFLDMEGKKAYYWANVTHHGWKYTPSQTNITKWYLQGQNNITYQETVNTQTATWTAYTYPDWQEVTTTKTKNKKKEETYQSISFAGKECKEFKLVYENTLQPSGQPAIKYDLGENNVEILDPLINSTDYQSNFSQDLNASLTTATITGPFNLSGTGNTSYANSTNLWAQWQLEDAVDSTTAKDDVGINKSLIVQSNNWTFGKTGAIGAGGGPNGTGFASIGVNDTYNGFMCIPAVDLLPPNVTIRLHLKIHTLNVKGNTPNESPILFGNSMAVDINRTGHLVIDGIDSTPSATGRDMVWSNTALSTGTFYNLGITYNGTKIRVFIDGIDRSQYNNTAAFALSLTSDNKFVVGADSADCSARPCRAYDSSKGTESTCLNATYDQIVWENITRTSFPTIGGRGVSDHASTTNNVTRFRTMVSSSNGNVNYSVSFDGGSNNTNNVSNNTIYNWTFNLRTAFKYFVDYPASADAYYLNITMASPTVNESILNSKNITHNSTLNITVQCEDGLPSPTFYYYDNTTLFNINTNTGNINYDPTQSQTGNYQIGITCEESNYNTTRPFNLTISNSAINITSVTINPSGATATDTLRCDWTGTDTENDADAGSTYRWNVNNITIIPNTHSITTGYAANDYVNCEVLGYDGLYNSTNYANSSGIRISTGGGSGGGGSEDEESTSQEEEEEETPITPPPVTIPLYSPPPELPPLEEIFKEIPPPEICGDNICSQTESTYSCSADCPFDLDVVLFEFGRLKCLTERNCQSNTNFIATLLLSVILGGLLLFLLLKDKDEKKKKKRR